MHSSGDHSRPDSPIPPDERDALWRLLGRFPPREASPSFVASTLRTTRLAEASRQGGGGFPWVRWILAPALAGTAVLVLAINPGFLRDGNHSVEPDGGLRAEHIEILTEELHLMTYVNELLTVSDPTTLDDAGLAELLF